MTNDNERHTVWMAPEVWAMVEGHYHADNCSTKNQYIAKAIRFYSGYLDAAGADEYLPHVLPNVLEGKLGALGSRVGRLLFKLAVELDLNANIHATLGEYSPDAVERLRGQCVQRVKQTNREISFKDALRSQPVDLDTVMQEAERHDGPMWTFIYSLRREDAARLRL